MISGLSRVLNVAYMIFSPICKPEVVLIEFLRY